jgi:hypothetical protein
MFYITDPKRSTAVCAPSKEIMAAWMTILRKACAGGVTKRFLSLSLSHTHTLSPGFAFLSFVDLIFHSFTRQVSILIKDQDVSSLRKSAADEELRKVTHLSSSFSYRYFALLFILLF